VDLDLAAVEVERRRSNWRRDGIAVGPITWREQGEGWPPTLKTDRAEIRDADSIGIALSKDRQEGEVVLFKGGWCDFSYWSGRSTDEPEQGAPGYPSAMTVDGFGEVLDRLAACFL